MGGLLLGCSGWSYPDPAEKGGWTGAFYPDSKTRRLAFYGQFFNTAEMDSTFYEKFYSQMTLNNHYNSSSSLSFHTSQKLCDEETTKSDS